MRLFLKDDILFSLSHSTSLLLSLVVISATSSAHLLKEKSASGQVTRYCDPLTSICYASYTNANNVAIRVAIPEASQAPFDLILQVVAPIDHKWVGFSFQQGMTYSPLAVGWPNGNNVVFSPRWATYVLVLSFSHTVAPGYTNLVFVTNHEQGLQRSSNLCWCYPYRSPRNWG